MKIELKNVKYAAFASQETNCFQATVYVDGKALCFVDNDGHGGCNRVHPVKGRTQQEVDAVDNRLKAEATPPQNPEPYEQELWDKGYRPGLEEAVGTALAEWLQARDLKRLLGRKTVAVDKGELVSFKSKYSEPFAEKVRQRYPGIQILNNLPFEQAMALYIKHG